MILEAFTAKTCATVGYVEAHLHGMNIRNLEGAIVRPGDIWFDPVQNQMNIWSGSKWELFRTQPAEVKAKYLIKVRGER